MAFDTVVGYSYNASCYCDDCTKEFIFDQIQKSHEDFSLRDDNRIWQIFELDDYNYYDYSFIDYLRSKFKWSMMDELTELVKDNEGNNLHPIFEQEEIIDYSEYCDHILYHLENDNEAKQLIEANCFSEGFLEQYYIDMDYLSYDKAKKQFIARVDYDWINEFNNENETNRQNAIIEYIDNQVRKVLEIELWQTLKWTFYLQEHDHDDCSNTHNTVIIIELI